MYWNDSEVTMKDVDYLIKLIILTKTNIVLTQT